jgi:hypothetical protein
MKPPVHVPSGVERESAERSVRKRILREGALSGDPWRNGWWVERLVTYWLTPREKAVAWHLYGDRQIWTLAWLLQAGLAIPLSTILYFLLKYGNGSEVHFLNCMLILMLVSICEILFLMVRAGPKSSTSLCHPLFPLDFDETTRVLLKTYWLRLLCSVPALLLVIGVNALLSSATVFRLADMGCTLAATVTGFSFLFACCFFGANSRFVWHPSRLFLGLLVMANMYGIFGVFFASFHLPAALFASVGYVTLCLLTWLYFRWHYHRHMDFHDPKFAQPQDAGALRRR